MGRAIPLTFLAGGCWGLANWGGAGAAWRVPGARRAEVTCPPAERYSKINKMIIRNMIIRLLDFNILRSNIEHEVVVFHLPAEYID